MPKVYITASLCTLVPTHCASAAAEGDAKTPEESGSISEAYTQLWQVIRLPAVKRFAVVLVTFRYKRQHHFVSVALPCKLMIDITLVDTDVCIWLRTENSTTVFGMLKTGRLFEFPVQEQCVSV